MQKKDKDRMRNLGARWQGRHETAVHDMRAVGREVLFPNMCCMYLGP